MLAHRQARVHRCIHDRVTNPAKSRPPPEWHVTIPTKPSAVTVVGLGTIGTVRPSRRPDAAKAFPAGGEAEREGLRGSWREAQEAWRSKGFPGAAAQPHPPPSAWQSTIRPCRTRSPSEQAAAVHSVNPPSGCTTSVPWQWSMPASHEAHSIKPWYHREPRGRGTPATACRTVTRPGIRPIWASASAALASSSRPAFRPHRTPPKRTSPHGTSSRRPHWPAVPPSGRRRRPSR